MSKDLRLVIYATLRAMVDTDPIGCVGFTAKRLARELPEHTESDLILALEWLCQSGLTSGLPDEDEVGLPTVSYAHIGQERCEPFLAEIRPAPARLGPRLRQSMLAAGACAEAGR